MRPVARSIRCCTCTSRRGPTTVSRLQQPACVVRACCWTSGGTPQRPGRWLCTARLASGALARSLPRMCCASACTALWRWHRRQLPMAAAARRAPRRAPTMQVARLQRSPRCAPSRCMCRTVLAKRTERCQHDAHGAVIATHHAGVCCLVQGVNSNGQTTFFPVSCTPLLCCLRLSHCMRCRSHTQYLINLSASFV